MSELALKARAQNTEDEPAVFIVRRPYRWVRHPWYLVAHVFWSCVDFTSGRLLLNVLWTDWVCLGTRPEQIDRGTSMGKYREQVRDAHSLASSSWDVVRFGS